MNHMQSKLCQLKSKIFSSTYDIFPRLFLTEKPAAQTARLHASMIRQSCKVSKQPTVKCALHSAYFQPCLVIPGLTSQQTKTFSKSTMETVEIDRDKDTRTTSMTSFQYRLVFLLTLNMQMFAVFEQVFICCVSVNVKNKSKTSVWST